MLINNTNTFTGVVGKCEKNEGGRKEGREGGEKKARAARPRGPGLEPGTYRVLGEGPQLQTTEVVNPKRTGLFGPISQPGGGFRPPKISETDWRNIKCVIPVDSYDPPESIGTKKSTNIPCMTPQWRHKWRHVKNKKFVKIMVFRYFFAVFSSKVAFFGNDVCQSMLTLVLTPNKPNK